MSRIVILFIAILLSINVIAQKNNIDMSKWYAMDSIAGQIDRDEVKDFIIIYNYKSMNKPSGIVFPITIKTSQINKPIISLHVIGKKYYEFTDLNKNGFSIIQKGERSDYNIYVMEFRYDISSKKICLNRSQIISEIKKGKINPKTGDFVYSDVVRKIISDKKYESQNILIEEVDFYSVFK